MLSLFILGVVHTLGLDKFIMTCIHRYGVFPGGTVVKNQPANAGDTGDMDSIPGLGKSPGEGNGNPLQYSCLGESHGQRSIRSQRVGHD